MLTNNKNKNCNNKKSNYLLIKNNRRSFLLLILFFSLNIIIIFFDAIKEVDRPLRKDNYIKINLYWTPKIIAYLFIMLIMVMWVINFANYNKDIDKNKTINIYHKYENLIYENLKSTEKKRTKWYYNIWFTIYDATSLFIKKVAVTTLLVVTMCFFMSKLLPFISFNAKYFDKYIDNNFYLFFQLFEKQPDHTNKLILTCLTLAYIGLVIYRIYNLCVVISSKIQFNNWKNILKQYKKENKCNEVILCLIEAICLEKKKEYKFHKQRSLVVILPTFILSSLIFALEFLYYKIPQNSKIFDIIALLSIAFILSYQIVRFIVYGLDYSTNKDYNLKCGIKFKLTLANIMNEQIDEMLSSSNESISTIVNMAIIEELKEFKQDLEYLKNN